MNESSTINVHDAKSRLSELLARVEKGEEFVIARAGKPVALLSAISKPRPEFGFMRELLAIPDEMWFDELPEDELALWEGVAVE